jgi:hypothetical protein
MCRLYPLITTHFERSFLGKLPEKLRALDERDGDHHSPGNLDDLDEFVFLYATKEMGNVTTDPRYVLSLGTIFWHRLYHLVHR